ncbi:hypothetical protein Tco_0487988 [Tanacetum coccineum]
MRAPLRARFKDLPTSDMKEILLQCMLEENYDKGHEDHRMAYEALQKSILRDENEQFNADKTEECKKMKSKQDSPKTLPESPPPLPSGASGASGTTGAIDSAQDPLPPPQSSTTNPDDQSPGSTAPGSSKTAAITAYTAWTTTTSRFEPSALSIPEDVFMHEDLVSEYESLLLPETELVIPSSSLPVPIHNLGHLRHLQLLTYPRELSLFTDRYIGVFLDCSGKKCKESIALTQNTWNDHPGDRLALSITKMKAAYYPDVGLEQMRQKFYIDRHSAETNRRAIVSGLTKGILSVRTGSKSLSIYGYDYMKKIILRRAYNHGILYYCLKNDFKNQYPKQLMDQESGYQQLVKILQLMASRVTKLAEPHLTSAGSYRASSFKHDYKILDSSKNPYLFRMTKKYANAQGAFN